MYLRVTERQNRDGSSVTYYALAESIWNSEAKRREARVIHSFGRADQLDRAAWNGWHGDRPKLSPRRHGRYCLGQRDDE